MAQIDVIAACVVYGPHKRQSGRQGVEHDTPQHTSDPVPLQHSGGMQQEQVRSLHALRGIPVAVRQAARKDKVNVFRLGKVHRK